MTLPRPEPVGSLTTLTVLTSFSQLASPEVKPLFFSRFSPVVALTAADSGTVITASYSDGYGNYIIIDHGNGMQTLYAHLSGMAVGEGSSVSQGQTIGYVGATGRATGTHLHFEVFVGGSRTDPAGYFGGLSYYNC